MYTLCLASNGEDSDSNSAHGLWPLGGLSVGLCGTLGSESRRVAAAPERPRFGTNSCAGRAGGGTTTAMHAMPVMIWPVACGSWALALWGHCGMLDPLTWLRPHKAIPNRHSLADRSWAPPPLHPTSPTAVCCGRRRLNRHSHDLAVAPPHNHIISQSDLGRQTTCVSGVRVPECRGKSWRVPPWGRKEIRG